MSEPITNDDLLDAGERRTGLQRAQLFRMVGKSAAIRYVASSEHGKNFVLKGGSLLTHVYGSPRQSLADADYVHLEPNTVMTDDIEDAFTVIDSERGFTMNADFRYEDQRGFEGKATFEIEGIFLRPKNPRAREINITISIRKGEWLDKQDPIEYHDPLLAGDNRFLVQGLSIAELSAEKTLGWCSKDLAKHLVDIGYVQREHAASLDWDWLAELICLKFKAERGARRYRGAQITRIADLGARFTSHERLEILLHEGWGALAANELFFLPQELQHGSDQVLADPANIERLALEYWAQLEPALAKAAARHRI